MIIIVVMLLILVVYPFVPSGHLEGTEGEMGITIEREKLVAVVVLPMVDEVV
jgi:F0F1-type ATP synthase epsilon subunit